MKPYIFGARNGIYMSTCRDVRLAREAFKVRQRRLLPRRSVLFVGTKKQAQTRGREATRSRPVQRG